MTIREMIDSSKNTAELQRIVDELSIKWGCDYFLSFSEQAKRFDHNSKQRLTFEYAEQKRNQLNREI